MRRLLKFLHTMGAAGFIGAIGSLLALMALAQATPDPATYVLLCRAMAAVNTYVFFPSLVLTLIPGLLAMAWSRAFHNLGWAWAKMASGVLVFEGGLVGIHGPIQQEAERSALALANPASGAEVIGSVGQGPLWVMLAVAAANVVLGVWRPRLGRRIAVEPAPEA